MTKNVSENERVFRVISGGLIASMAFWGPTNILFLLGLIPVLTGIIGFCPFYYSLGFSSINHDEEWRKKHKR